MNLGILRQESETEREGGRQTLKAGTNNVEGMGEGNSNNTGGRAGDGILPLPIYQR